jgi:hypothetical protein
LFLLLLLLLLLPCYLNDGRKSAPTATAWRGYRLEREREKEREADKTQWRIVDLRECHQAGKQKENNLSPKKKLKKKEREKEAKKRGGRCFVFAATCLPLRNTRVAAEIDSYGDPKEQKTNECFTQCERDREKKKRDSEQVRGGRRWRALFCVHMESAKPTLVTKPTLCSRGRGQEPTFVAKPSYVHIEVAKPSLLVIHIKATRPTLCFLKREQLLAPNGTGHTLVSFKRKN